MKQNLFALAGALAGGALGHFAFLWITSQGFYALILPGGLLGLGAGLVQNRSGFIAVLCGVLATALGVVSEYRFAPFVVDRSFQYFVSHLFNLQPITLIMIALGGFIGFWVPFRRKEQSPTPAVATSTGK